MIMNQRQKQYFRVPEEIVLQYRLIKLTEHTNSLIITMLELLIEESRGFLHLVGFTKRDLIQLKEISLSPIFVNSLTAVNRKSNVDSSESTKTLLNIFSENILKKNKKIIINQNQLLRLVHWYENTSEYPKGIVALQPNIIFDIALPHGPKALKDDFGIYIQNYIEGRLWTVSNSIQKYSIQKRLFIEEYLRQQKNCGDSGLVFSPSDIWRDNKLVGQGRFWELAFALEHEHYINIISFLCLTQEEKITFDALDKMQKEANALNKKIIQAKKVLQKTNEHNKLFSYYNDNYYYKNNLLEVNNSNTDYFIIFKTILQCCDGDGYISYKEICSRTNFTPAQVRKGVTEFFRRVKVKKKPFSSVLNNGQDIFQVIRGCGIKFNNPII